LCYFVGIKATLDIIVPVFDLEKGWATILVQKYLELQGALVHVCDCHLIVVDDGNGIAIKQEYNKISEQIPDFDWISYPKNRGKGFALRSAVKMSKSDFIMYTDVDFPYTLDCMVKMISNLISKEAEVVIGIRDESYYKELDGRRRKISYVLQKMNQWMFNLVTSDTQCGLKAFNSKNKEVFLSTQTNRYLIDLEFMKKLSGKNIHIETQEVELREGVHMGKISNLKLLHEGFNYIKILLFA